MSHTKKISKEQAMAAKHRRWARMKPDALKAEMQTEVDTLNATLASKLSILETKQTTLARMKAQTAAIREETAAIKAEVEEGRREVLKIKARSKSVMAMAANPATAPSMLNNPGGRTNAEIDAEADAAEARAMANRNA